MNKTFRTVKKNIVILLLCLYSLFLTPVANAGWFSDLLNYITSGEAGPPGLCGGSEPPTRGNPSNGPSGPKEVPR